MLFEIQTCDQLANRFTTRWKVPSDLFYFEGHFPDRPILPAVAIIDISIEFLKKALNLDDLRIKAIKSAKFSCPVLPGSNLTISTQMIRSGEWEVEWRLEDGASQHVSAAQLTINF